jgi:integrase
MPNRSELTNKTITLAPPGRHHAGIQGLYLYVSPDGQVRRWIYRFTSPVSHKVTEAGFGSVSVLSLAEAKNKAQDYARVIARGICPIAAKRAERSEQVPFTEVAEEWINTHKASWKIDSRGGSQMRNCKLMLFTHGKALANAPVATITPDIIQDALKGLWAKHPPQGRRTLGLIERVLDYAKAKGLRQGDNPASWRGLMEYRFPKARKTDRGHYAAMPYEQMPEFMRALRQRQERSTGAVALEFVILTACRSGEALGMTWSEIDWEKKLWVLPKERTKQGREHTVPLSDRAMVLLARQKEHSHGSGYVFEGYNRTRMAEQSMISVLRVMGVKTTCHGFRSSFRDWAGNETHFAREPVEHCLAHQLGNSTEQAYRRQSALKKRQEIMQAWADYCGSIVIPPG